MPIKVIATDLPKRLRESVTHTIQTALSEARGEWTASIKSDPRNNAWDVEVTGPRRAPWERRFSGDDRDADVISEAIRPLTESSENSPGSKHQLNDALSALAIQGIAFLSKTDGSGEHTYVLDRVELKESELLYLHSQGALSRRGIQKYLLSRKAA
jgi:hypothetical protein